MTVRSCVFVLLFVQAISGHAESCLALSGEQIRAADLAAAIPALNRMDQDFSFGFLPLPGVHRVFRRAEILSTARSHELSLDASEVPSSICVERKTRALTEAQVRQALLAGLGNPSIELELVDFSHFEIPEATITFPIANLGSPPAGRPDAPVLWIGKALYGTSRRMSIWATVKVRQEKKILVAATALAARRELSANDVRTEQRYVFPFPDAEPLSPENVAGRALRRSVGAGQCITRDLLADLPAVTRGDRTAVTVQSGAVSICFEAKAESGGSTGDSIVLSSPSGTKFRGVVVAKGKVLVQLAGRS